MAQDPSSIPNSQNLKNPSSPPFNPSTPLNPIRDVNRHDLLLDANNNNNSNDNDNHNSITEGDDEFFKKMRGWLMVVAILAAGSTYQAGLNPPGGFWQDDTDPLHVAGNPVMHDKYFRRYQTFIYCNAISFLSSLVIIILLMKRGFFLDPKKIQVLKITMVLDLFSFMAAYAAGSSRRVSSSFYVFLLMGAVFLYVFLMFLMAAYDARALRRTVMCQPSMARSENIV